MSSFVSVSSDVIGYCSANSATTSVTRKKLPNNDFTRKMRDCDTFIKIP